MNFMQRRRFLWAVFLIGIWLIAVVANATTFARLPFEELVRQSTAVARLRCLGSESSWQNGELWTETRFEVLERSKGTLPGMVSVRMMGGTAGGLHSRVEGVPVFQTGEEVYLFLYGGTSEAYRVTGWQQGTFRIRRDAQNGIERVTQDSVATPIFDAQTKQFRRGGVRNLPVAIFQLKLKKALEREMN
ncbi:MAG: hypothetical protein PVS2B2_08550 [Candidatus Acidiferrum sp.]